VTGQVANRVAPLALGLGNERFRPPAVGKLPGQETGQIGAGNDQQWRQQPEFTNSDF